MELICGASKTDVGVTVERLVGVDVDGCEEGSIVIETLGLFDGIKVGGCDWIDDGCKDGERDGHAVTKALGDIDGLRLGDEVVELEGT